jgi:hypothetical protein
VNGDVAFSNLWITVSMAAGITKSSGIYFYLKRLLPFISGAAFRRVHPAMRPASPRSCRPEEGVGPDGGYLCWNQGQMFIQPVSEALDFIKHRVREMNAGTLRGRSAT